MSVFLYLSLGPLLFVLAMIFRARPPREINGIYGYRTKRSMDSKEAWDLGNTLSIKLLVRFCVLLNVIQLAAFACLKTEHAVLITCIVMIIGLVAIMPMVEKKLKEAGHG